MCAVASQDIIPIDRAGEPVAARCEDRELAHFETARDALSKSRDALSKSKASREAVILSRRLRSLLPTAPGSARVHFPVLSTKLLSLRQLLEPQLRHSALETTATSFSVMPAGTRISLQRRTYANVLQHGGGQHSSPETSTIIWTKRSRTSSYSG